MNAEVKELKQESKKLKQALEEIRDFSHNHCMNCEDLLNPSHSCEGCSFAELKAKIDEVLK